MKCNEEVVSLQPMFTPKRFETSSSFVICPLSEGYSQGLDAFRSFFKQQYTRFSIRYVLCWTKKILRIKHISGST